MSGIKENLIICGYLFQNMEQEEIDEVFKEIFLELDSIFEHSDDIDDFYKKVDKDYFKVFRNTQSIQFVKYTVYHESNILSLEIFNKERYNQSYPKAEIVSFLTNLS